MYCTSVELAFVAGGAEKLVDLTDRDKDGAADADVIEAAIERAGKKIDEYAAKQYLVPMDPVDDGIKWRCAEIAVFLLRQDLGSDAEGQVKAWEGHQKWLEDLAAGNVVVASTPQPTKSTMRIDAAKKPTLRTVTRDKLKGAW